MGERLEFGCSSYEAQKVGYRSGADRRRPEAAHIGMVGREANPSVLEKTSNEIATTPYRSTTCSTRGGCGCDRDGRTMVTVVPG